MKDTKLMTLRVVAIEKGDRARIEYGDMKALCESIKEHGLIHPVAVMELPDKEDRWQLLAGGRRLAAVRMLKLSTIAANVYPYIEDVRERQLIELVENIHRKELTWQEECKLKQQIHEQMIAIHGDAARGPTADKADPGWTLRDTAQLIGESRRTIARDIALAEAVKADKELSKQPNKTAAQKLMLDKVEKEMYEELAQRQQEKLKTVLTPEADQHRAVIDSYILGDVFETLEKFPDERFDFVDLDWPYNVSLAAKTFVAEGTEAIDDLMGAEDVSEEDFIKFMHEVLRAVYRVMSKNSWIIVWHALAPWYQPTLDALREEHFAVTCMPAFWCKNNGRTRCPNQILPCTVEPFIYARKGNAMLHTVGRRLGNQFIWPQSSRNRQCHPTEKPVMLMQEILEVFTLPTHRVLSPFAGSGNTILAAANCGREAVGIDKNPHYKAKFVHNAKVSAPGRYTSYSPDKHDSYIRRAKGGNS